MIVGFSLGAALSVGSSLGTGVIIGAAVGSGAFVGSAVGVAIGSSLGSTVGSLLGATVGLLLGSTGALSKYFAQKYVFSCTVYIIPGAYPCTSRSLYHRKIKFSFGLFGKIISEPCSTVTVQTSSTVSNVTVTNFVVVPPVEIVSFENKSSVPSAPSV